MFDSKNIVCNSSFILRRERMLPNEQLVFRTVEETGMRQVKKINTLNAIEMNKNLYTLLIAFLALTIAAGIYDIAVTLQFGTDIYKAGSYIAWFSVFNVTGFIGSILVLLYYLYRNYRLAFFAGTIAVIANLGYFYIFFASQLSAFYKPAIILNIAATIVYAVTLIFSATRNRHWLKRAGILLLVITLLLTFTFIAGIYAKDIHLISLLRKITQWASFALSLVDVMFIINFRDEIRDLKTGNANSTGRKYLEIAVGLLATVAAAGIIAIGTLLVTESSSQKGWQEENAQHALQMVSLAGGARTFVDSDGDSLQYILVKPQKYDPQKKYPLVVCLPYNGYEAPAAEALTTGMDRYTYPAYIFVPFCPEGAGWGGIFGTPSLESLVYETISALDDPGIDTNRRYIIGVSRGGYGTWQFICARPDLFAAAIPVCGGGDPDQASKIVNMPVWAFHGAKDKNVPVSGSRDMIWAIKKAGGHPQYTEYPNEAHNIWNRVVETPGLWKWLFDQKKE